MSLDVRDLQVGKIYNIIEDIKPSSWQTIEGPDRYALRSGTRFIKITNKTNPFPGSILYTIQALNDDLTPKTIRTPHNDPMYGKRLRVHYPNSVYRYHPYVDVFAPKLYNEDKQKIEQAELDKRIVPVVQEVLDKKGVPSTKATGPLGNILEMAGIKTPKSSFGGKKTRRGKKVKRKTHKRK